MKIKMFVIFDTKAKFYNKPFLLQNDSIALRAFTDLANDPSTDVCKHPEDFQLFSIGEFDDETAGIKSTNPIIIARAHEIKKSTSIEILTEQQKEGISI